MLNRNGVRIKKHGEPYIILVFIVMAVLAALYANYAVVYLKSIEQTEISRVDILVCSQRMMLRTCMIYILLLLLFTRAVRNDFLYYNVLRHKKRTSIWNYQLRKLSALGLAATLIYSGSSILWTAVMCKEKINWQNVYSFFALSTGKTIRLSYAAVLTAYIMAGILMTELIMIVSLLLYWITNQMALVWIGVLTLYVADIYSINKVFRLITISYKNWCDKKIGIHMAGMAVLCVVLYIMGRYAANKKDFLPKRCR